MDPVWFESPFISLPGVDPITGERNPNMIMASVGYVGERDRSTPSQGIPYVCRIAVGVANPNVLGNINVQTGIFLPPNTSFATPPEIQCLINRVYPDPDHVELPRDVTGDV